jgi:hypothetical protein
MANEFARNIQDNSINPSSTFTLPSALSLSTTSSVIDLGADTVKCEMMELELSVPSLTSTMSPSAATGGVTYIIESSTTSAFSAVARTIVSKTLAGSSSGTVATALRCRVPSDCERYVRGKITFAATTADASSLAATLSARF